MLWRFRFVLAWGFGHMYDLARTYLQYKLTGGRAIYDMGVVGGIL